MRAPVRRVSGALAGAVLAAGLLAAPAHADPASLSGTLTLADTGQPAQGCVNVYTAEDASYAGGACTSDETGQWLVDGLDSTVAYRVQGSVWDGEHVDTWAGGGYSFVTAADVAAPGEVDIAVELGARFEGTLTNADGTPAVDVSVDVAAPGDGDAVGYGYTDESGAWSTVVPAGEWIVRFSAWPAVQYAFGQESAEAAEHFVAVAGQTTRVDDQLLGGATISGTVVDEASGAPIAGACVEVTSPVDEWQSAGSACTDAEGRYTADLWGGPGTYTLAIEDPEGRYAGEYLGDTRVLAEATTFQVERGAPVVVDADLTAGATLTGRVVDSKTGQPVASVCPSAYDGNAGPSLRWTVPVCSDETGAWQLKGVPAAEVALNFGQSEYPAVYADAWAYKATSQATAALVTVAAGTTTPIRDVKMVPGGTVTGRVTDQFGTPVAGAWVNVEGNYSGRAGPGEGRWTAQTDADGRYTVHGVPAGTYRPFVHAGDDGALAPEWAGDAVTKADADSISVKSLKTTTFDASLVHASRITGTVVDATGAPSQDYWAGLIYSASGDYIGDFDAYQDGTFRSTALPAGAFKLLLEGWNEDGTFTSFWYDGASVEADATAVSLEVGEERAITVRVP